MPAQTATADRLVPKRAFSAPFFSCCLPGRFLAADGSSGFGKVSWRGPVGYSAAPTLSPSTQDVGEMGQAQNAPSINQWPLHSAAKHQNSIVGIC